MLKRWIITLVVVAVAIVGAVAWVVWPRTVPLAECSDIYRRYADTPGVNAAYIKDYRVNDTMTVCATVLEAVDSASWEDMQNDFNVKLPDVVLKFMNGKLPKRDIKLVPKYDYHLPMDSVFVNNDLIVTMRHSHIICIFHIENQEQYHAVYKKQFNDMNPKY